MSEAVNLKKFVAILAKQVQDIEFAAQDIMIARLVRYAYGDQIDMLGALVGQPRTSLDDNIYRAAIVLKIYTNNSSGGAEEVAHIAKQVSGATTVEYAEIGPGSYRLYFTGATLAADLLSSIQRLTVAGVRLLGVHTGALRQFKMGDRVNQSLLHE